MAERGGHGGTDTGGQTERFPVSHSVKYCEPVRVAFQRPDKIAENAPSVPEIHGPDYESRLGLDSNKW
jgi:hypothetical protein